MGITRNDLYAIVGSMIDGDGIVEVTDEEFDRLAREQGYVKGRSMMKMADLLLRVADDLDRLEELEPRSGRIGDANRLRRIGWLSDTLEAEDER